MLVFIFWPSSPFWLHKIIIIHFQGFVATLDAEKKDKVLIKLLGLGRGSLDFAKNLNHPQRICQSGASVECAGQCRMNKKMSAARGLHALPTIHPFQIYA